MAQHDYVISNQGFASYRSDHNSSLSAIVSNNSGATEPSTTYAYQWWYDETTDTLKMRNSDNDAWITIFTFDQTADTYSLTTDVDITGSTPLIHIDSTSSGTSSFNGSGAGLLLTAFGMNNTTAKFTPAIQFGSTDPNLTSTNPKVGAAINAIATESYGADTDGGMALAFYTTPDNPGTGQTTTERMRIVSGNVLIGATTTASSDFGAKFLVDDTSEILAIHRQAADGDFIQFTRGGSDSGNIKHSGGNLVINAVNDFEIQTNDGTDVVHVNSSGNVGINTTSPAATLDVNGGLNCGFLQSSSSIYASSIFRNTDGGTAAAPSIQPGNDNDTGMFLAASNTIGFSTAGSERIRIQSNGALKIGTPAPSSDTPGSGNSDEGVCFRGGTLEQFFINSNSTPCFFGRTIDGSIVALLSGGNLEGSINISGTTTSYNGFTGTHWSRLVDNSKPTILKGTILESLDEMMDWYQVQFDITETDDEGNETTRTEKQSYALGDGESVGDVITYNYEGADYQATIIQEGDVKHTKSKISNTVDAKNVYGVFVDWDNDDDTVNDMYVAQTGTFVIRINGSETVSKGDLIQSNGDGTGKVQSDDIIRASTVAKVISSTKVETYDDGSYIVPCTLHC